MIYHGYSSDITLRSSESMLTLYTFKNSGTFCHANWQHSWSDRHRVAWHSPYAESPSTTSASASGLNLLCFSHHSACHIKNDRIRHISSCKSSTSSFQRSSLARDRHHSICRAERHTQYPLNKKIHQKIPSSTPLSDFPSLSMPCDFQIHDTVLLPLLSPIRASERPHMSSSAKKCRLTCHCRLGISYLC